MGPWYLVSIVLMSSWNFYPCSSRAAPKFRLKEYLQRETSFGTFGGEMCEEFRNISISIYRLTSANLALTGEPQNRNRAFLNAEVELNVSINILKNRCIQIHIHAAYISSKYLERSKIILIDQSDVFEEWGGRCSSYELWKQERTTPSISMNNPWF